VERPGDKDKLANCWLKIIELSDVDYVVETSTIVRSDLTRIRENIKSSGNELLKKVEVLSELPTLRPLLVSGALKDARSSSLTIQFEDFILLLRALVSVQGLVVELFSVKFPI
jgi:hypothetical protein